MLRSVKTPYTEYRQCQLGICRLLPQSIDIDSRRERHIIQPSWSRKEPGRIMACQYLRRLCRANGYGCYADSANARHALIN